MENLFQGIFDSSVIGVGDFLLCLAVALVLGIGLALAYTVKTRYTKSFVITLALLPAIVTVVIMMVNGNIGASVAVAGTFGLIRFRSAQGTAKEITAVFLAMASGLMIGMGYLAYAVLFTLIAAGMLILLTVTKFGEDRSDDTERIIKIMIPEDMDYRNTFDGIFDTYTESHREIGLKTMNYGSMFRVTYEVKLKNEGEEKAMIDALRCENANLEISSSRIADERTEL